MFLGAPCIFLQIRALKEALVSTTATTSAAAAVAAAGRNSPKASAESTTRSAPIDAAEGGGDVKSGGAGEGAQREVENLRERMDDALGEASRATDELRRLRFA